MCHGHIDPKFLSREMEARTAGLGAQRPILRPLLAAVRARLARANAAPEPEPDPIPAE